MKSSITIHFFTRQQKEAKNPTNTYIHKKMKKIGIEQYLIRKHIHVAINHPSELKFDEKDSFEKAIKDCVEQLEGGGIIYLTAK